VNNPDAQTGVVIRMYHKDHTELYGKGSGHELKLPTARPVEELKSSRYEECARCCMFNIIVASLRERSTLIWFGNL
jgi:hypothetical protein